MRRVAVVTVCVGMLAVGRVGAQDPSVTPIAIALRTAIAEAELPADSGQLVVTREALGRLYDAAGLEPVWSALGRPTHQARMFVARVAALADRGLPPAVYAPDRLARWIAMLDAAEANDPREHARFDVAMSITAMRVLTHLHAGRVDPASLGIDLLRAHEHVDLAGLALALARAADVDSVMAAAEPRYPGYRALSAVLARYRALAADDGLPTPRLLDTLVRRGDRYDDAPALRRLLSALGDLDPPAWSAPADSLTYDGTLAAAVARFQQRHGLEADSVLGPATMAALRVPLSRRVEQIELTLERWRWLPDSTLPRYLIVNVATFRLDAFVPAGGDAPALAMKVIAGEARRTHETPLFLGTMAEVVFRPYWDVPYGIARSELVPMIRRDPDYLDRERLEIVDGRDEDAVIHPLTPENLDRILAGSLRLRQRPGPSNALGLVKFVFPNRYSVYLHGTPATELFARTRRDFSHGCIRIEDPPTLAELVLRDQQPWDRDAIARAMGDTVTTRVALRDPVTVVVFYATAAVDEMGRVHFVPDIYGHDVRLRAALAR